MALPQTSSSCPDPGPGHPRRCGIADRVRDAPQPMTTSPPAQYSVQPGAVERYQSPALPSQGRSRHPDPSTARDMIAAVDNIDDGGANDASAPTQSRSPRRPRRLIGCRRAPALSENPFLYAWFVLRGGVPAQIVLVEVGGSMDPLECTAHKLSADRTISIKASAGDIHSSQRSTINARTHVYHMMDPDYNLMARLSLVEDVNRLVDRSSSASEKSDGRGLPLGLPFRANGFDDGESQLMANFASLPQPPPPPRRCNIDQSECQTGAPPPSSAASLVSHPELRFWGVENSPARRSQSSLSQAIRWTSMLGTRRGLECNVLCSNGSTYSAYGIVELPANFNYEALLEQASAHELANPPDDIDDAQSTAIVQDNAGNNLLTPNSSSPAGPCLPSTENSSGASTTSPANLQRKRRRIEIYELPAAAAAYSAKHAKLQDADTEYTKGQLVGSLLLIPSATITNSNTPVAPNEARASFTQYAPGGLFRYVGYGFRLKGWAEKNKIQKAPLSHDASQAGQLEG
ncbi:hypothetical protein BJ912DRAFT_926686 [Pholiota molesta]|nr:hypothetical protein BJ912DRAFT_926686 [Pholiota molesta]